MALRQRVHVQQHLFRRDGVVGAVVGCVAAAVDRVLLALDGVGVVEPLAVAHGQRRVGLLDVAQHFAVERRLQVFRACQVCGGVGVLRASGIQAPPAILSRAARSNRPAAFASCMWVGCGSRRATGASRFDSHAQKHTVCPVALLLTAGDASGGAGEPGGTGCAYHCSVMARWQSRVAVTLASDCASWFVGGLPASAEAAEGHCRADELRDGPGRRAERQHQEPTWTRSAAAWRRRPRRRYLSLPCTRIDGDVDAQTFTTDLYHQWKIGASQDRPWRSAAVFHRRSQALDHDRVMGWRAFCPMPRPATLAGRWCRTCRPATTTARCGPASTMLRRSLRRTPA